MKANGIFKISVTKVGENQPYKTKYITEKFLIRFIHLFYQGASEVLTEWNTPFEQKRMAKDLKGRECYYNRTLLAIYDKEKLEDFETKTWQEKEIIDINELHVVGINMF